MTNPMNVTFHSVGREDHALRKECDLAHKIAAADSAVACFTATRGHAPGSWEELARDTDCGAFGAQRDWQGRPLVIKTVRGAAVVTDADGSRGGTWLMCGPGVLGLLVLLLLVLGTTVAVVGAIKRAWWVALIGIAMLGAAYILNYTGPIA